MKLTHQRSHRRRFGVATLFVSACLAAGIHATANAQSRGQESSHGRRLHQVARHQRLVDLRRRQVGDVRAVAHEHRADRRQAGHAPRAPRAIARTSRSRTRRRRRSPPTRAGSRTRSIPTPAVVAVAVDAAVVAARARRRARRAGRRAADRRAAPAIPRRVELRNLATGAVQAWQDMQSFTFAGTSSHLILRRRAPVVAGAGGRGAGAAPGGAPAVALGGAAALKPNRPTRLRRHRPRSHHRTRPAARQRRRNLVQQEGRPARLHGRRTRRVTATVSSCSTCAPAA